jgi:hypothetical protein
VIVAGVAGWVNETTFDSFGKGDETVKVTFPPTLEAEHPVLGGALACVQMTPMLS